MTPDPRDIRDAEMLCRQNALRMFEDSRNLLLHAPPRAEDRRTYDHNLKVAHHLNSIGHAWMRVAGVHNEYATELEQDAEVAS